MNDNFNKNATSKDDISHNLVRLYQSKFFHNQRLLSDFHINIQDIEYWYWIIDLYDNFLNQEIKSAIVPKKIHQVWIGSNFPKKYQKWADSWKIKNPDFEYYLWDEKEILKLGLDAEKEYRSTNNLGIKSDIARYEILNRFGGVYVDTDFECLKPLDPKFLTYDFVGSQLFSYEPQISNAIIFATKNNVILKALISNLRESKKIKTGMEVLSYSGAIYLSNIIKELKNNIYNLVLLPSQYFFPWPNFYKKYDENIQRFLTENSYGVHHWEVSWLKISRFERFKNFIRLNK